MTWFHIQDFQCIMWPWAVYITFENYFSNYILRFSVSEIFMQLYNKTWTYPSFFDTLILSNPPQYNLFLI